MCAVPNVTTLSIVSAVPLSLCHVFFFNDTATTEIYTLSLHDALPIFSSHPRESAPPAASARRLPCAPRCGFPCLRPRSDRKSTRLNSSHQIISYAVFCLKKKNMLSHALVCRRFHTDYSSLCSIGPECV